MCTECFTAQHELTNTGKNVSGILLMKYFMTMCGTLVGGDGGTRAELHGADKR